MDFLRKVCSGLWNLNVWSIMWGWGSTLRARMARGFSSSLLNVTCEEI